MLSMERKQDRENHLPKLDEILSQAGNGTKIVPGHGRLGNKADLTKFREMLITARDRIEKMKSAGKSVQESLAEKPLGFPAGRSVNSNANRKDFYSPWNLDKTNLRNSTALAGM